MNLYQKQYQQKYCPQEFQKILKKSKPNYENISAIYIDRFEQYQNRLAIQKIAKTNGSIIATCQKININKHSYAVLYTFRMTNIKKMIKIIECYYDNTLIRKRYYCNTIKNIYDNKILNLLQAKQPNVFTSNYYQIDLYSQLYNQILLKHNGIYREYMQIHNICNGILSNYEIYHDLADRLNLEYFYNKNPNALIRNQYCDITTQRQGNAEIIKCGNSSVFTTYSNNNVDGVCKKVNMVLEWMKSSYRLTKLIEDDKTIVIDDNTNQVVLTEGIQKTETGDIYGYKKVMSLNNMPLVLELLIPKEAKISNGHSIKYRTNKVFVNKIFEISNNNTLVDSDIKEAKSIHDPSFMYFLEKYAVPDTFDIDLDRSCSNGLHYYLTQEGAISH